MGATTTRGNMLLSGCVRACVLCVRLRACRTWDRITADNLLSASYELVSKHNAGLQTNRPSPPHLARRVHARAD